MPADFLTRSRFYEIASQALKLKNNYLVLLATLAVIFLSFFSTAYAAGDQSVQVEYSWSVPWDSTTIDFSIDNAGSFVLHTVTYDLNNSNRQRKDSKIGRISGDEFSALKDAILAGDVSSFDPEYNDCATDLPSSSITFDIDNRKSTVLVYEATDDILKDCKAIKAPKELIGILQQLKALVANYNSAPRQ